MEPTGPVATKAEVIAQTPEWLALLKPAGWLTIPGRQSQAPVLSEWAQAQHGPVWVVHRLDLLTSGVCLLARTAEAHRKASMWFQKHEVRKGYDLLALGALHAPMLRIKVPVEGLASVTQVECRENFGASGCFLARAVPLTGRRHQIRVHLAHEGYPILGDATYGGPAEARLGKPGTSLPIGRVALHAARLELPSREVFEAPWPADFAGWVAALRRAEAPESSNESG